MLMGQRIERAFQLFAQRRARDAAFGEAADGFGEPAWDMLLLVYAHAGAGQNIDRDELIAAAGSGPGTASIYIDWMVSRRLVAIVDDGDGKTIQLLELGRTLMDRYLEGE